MISELSQDISLKTLYLKQKFCFYDREYMAGYPGGEAFPLLEIEKTLRDKIKFLEKG